MCATVPDIINIFTYIYLYVIIIYRPIIDVIGYIEYLNSKNSKCTKKRVNNYKLQKYIYISLYMVLWVVACGHCWVL